MATTKITDDAAEIIRLTAQLEMLKQMYEDDRRVIAQLLADKAEHAAAPQKAGGAGVAGVLIRGFSSMTVKQRAVAFATLVGCSYREIAAAIGVDETTIKLHLKAALVKLGGISRSEFMSHAQEVLDGIEAMGGSEAIFGMPLDWVKTRPEALLQQLAPRDGNYTLPPPAVKVSNNRRATDKKKGEVK